MSGTPDHIPQLETHRNLIYLLAESQLGRSLRRKIDADDIVQDVMSRAYMQFADIRRPNDAATVKSWLIAILANVLKDHLKHFTADKRDLGKEQSIDVRIERSSVGVEAFLAAEQTSPSVAAVRNEDSSRLVDGLRKMPEDMREVIVQKHINNKSLKEISEMTDRSVPSVAGLLRRGLARLRKNLS